ncbi:hypothetical protein OHA21_16200 [Actinoplanes sp. NBC_00393]|uniref:hypothetical protein n=1 Tax=Actinoplanes sp. NBC_00393 TaxID=2975953 RepID=UPI002E1BC1A3
MSFALATHTPAEMRTSEQAPHGGAWDDPPVQRIEVTNSGITVTTVTEPLVSVFGKEMRPGTTSIFQLSWSEISSTSLSATEFAPDNLRWVSLTVDTTWGEFSELPQEAEGFADAVRELTRRSRLAAPEVSTPGTFDELIWEAPALSR